MISSINTVVRLKCPVLLLQNSKRQDELAGRTGEQDVVNVAVVFGSIESRWKWSQRCRHTQLVLQGKLDEVVRGKVLFSIIVSSNALGIKLKW